MTPDSGIADKVRRVADAVLYEGYILYPYRASAQKNRSRWQFGVLMPPAFAAADPSETITMRSECVFTRDAPVSGTGLALEVTVRFLQVQRRRTAGSTDVWDEAVEREVTVTADGRALLGEADDSGEPGEPGRGSVASFGIPGGEDEEITDGTRVVRRREPLTGSVSLRAVPLPGPWRAARLIVEVTNETALGVIPVTRDEALPGALVAAHLIITLSGGAFVSMTDPPEWASAAVAGCESAGCWPALAGPGGSRTTMLAAPIILPEYAEVAAESPGELYDGTEIDEILTLRTLALSDEEKAAARATDPRAAALIDRVETMDAPTMEQLHGTIRALTSPGPANPSLASPDLTGADLTGAEVPWWDPGADASVSPGTDSVVVAGRELARGSRVTLRPGAHGESGSAGRAGKRADAQDMFLAGREALIEAVLEDVEGTAYLTVSLADDPGADIQAAHGRFLYFSPDEVEPR
ncbi:MAG TPA: hypothetical protein VGG75_15575 [Trebonia sp.]